jgi:hypothetical protein
MGSLTCTNGESVRLSASSSRPVAAFNGDMGKFIIMCMTRAAE